MGNAKMYNKLIVLEPDDFETKIVDEMNYPDTEKGKEDLKEKMKEIEEQKGVVSLVLKLSSNTRIA
mgnify:CR=1 FL=1